MLLDQKLLIGKTEAGKELFILPQMANRHGLITGASGSGKTITLKVMAESFSDAGVPVFLADVKGDLAGTAVKGEITEAIQKRLKRAKEEIELAKDYDFHIVNDDLDACAEELYRILQTRQAE